MAKRAEDEPPKGAPAWQSTFADLMNLLLCFFVLLFSMSTINEEKYELIVASFSQSTFSIFDGGASAIGDGVLVSNGVSQLNELSDYVSSMGLSTEGDDNTLEQQEQSSAETDTESEIKEQMTDQGLDESERLAEQIQEALDESDMSDQVDIDFTSQYVQLTLKGSLMFDSGSVELREECLPVLSQIGVILDKYATSTIEIEGHTDNVPMSGAKYSNNDELSDGRALSVFNYLLANTNLDPAMVKHCGRGEYVPVADNSTPEGRSKNRRVEIKVYNSLSNY